MPPSRSPQRPAGRGRRRRRRRNWAWRHRRLLFVIGLLAFSAAAAIAYQVANTPLPKEAALAQTTILTDTNGQPLASLSNGENRVEVSLDKVPQVVIDAVVATEDRGFFRHGGIDPAGMVRALFADLRGKPLQGGSTITQQYVKNAFLTHKRTLSRKLEEAILSVKLERKYSKRQILERYLNTIYFGRGAYGIQAASRAYFNVDVGQVGLNQAAFLAGLIRSPETADPARNPNAATLRRNQSLNDMVATHKLAPAEAAAARRVPVTSVVHINPAQLDPTVFGKGSEYFVSYVSTELVRRYGEKALSGGLRVRTTIDLGMQAQAYDAVYNLLTDAKYDPSGALVALDTTGAVRAMVGGRSYAASKVNLAVGTSGGGSGRQAGSTFKPVLLASVLTKGYSMLSQFPAPAEIIIPRGDNGADYHVKNFDGESFPNDITLLDATKYSVNTVYAQAVDSLGPRNIVQMGHALGVQTPLPANLSLVLGTTEVSVLEMANVYGTFMDRGADISPHVIAEVRDADGNLIDKTTPAVTHPLTAAVADKVTYALEQVVLAGTGTGANIGRPLAGKTGTTESNSDAWFIGYTPRLTAAVWMGYRDSKQPMVNVHGVKKVNGGSLPAEIFRRFMSAAATGPREDFPRVSTLNGNALGAPSVTLVTTSTSSTSSSTTSTTVGSTTTTGSTSTTHPSVPTTIGPGPSTTRPSATTLVARPAAGPGP